MPTHIDKLLRAINDFRLAEAVWEHAGDCADERDLDNLDCTRRMISAEAAMTAIWKATEALEATTALYRAETQTLRVAAKMLALKGEAARWNDPAARAAREAIVEGWHKEEAAAAEADRLAAREASIVEAGRKRRTPK